MENINLLKLVLDLLNSFLTLIHNIFRPKNNFPGNLTTDKKPVITLSQEEVAYIKSSIRLRYSSKKIENIIPTSEEIKPWIQIVSESLRKQWSQDSKLDNISLWLNITKNTNKFFCSPSISFDYISDSKKLKVFIHTSPEIDDLYIYEFVKNNNIPSKPKFFFSNKKWEKITKNILKLNEEKLSNEFSVDINNHTCCLNYKQGIVEKSIVFEI